MQWVSKRLRSASTLELYAQHWQRLVDALGQDLNRLTNLQEVMIFGSNQETHEEVMAHVMSVLWLLASATNLRLLHACLDKIPWFPPLSQLKHLLLDVTTDLGNLFAGIRHAEKLETLCLHSSDEKLVETPRLDLGNMPCLYSVGLNCIRPAALHLPCSCWLHLRGLETVDFSLSQWDTVLDKICTYDFDNIELSIVDTLPTFFGALHHIKTVVVQVDQLGTPEAYLSLEALRHVPDFYLGGRLVYVKVPARVAWQEANFGSSEELGLKFEDLEWFAKHVPIATLNYAHLEGPSMLHLCSAWTACGRPWSASAECRETVIQCPPDCRMIDNYSCFCGICIDCLRSA